MRWLDQYSALMVKQWTLAKRGWRSTVLRLLSSIIFLLLVWLIDLSLRASFERTSENRSIRDPEAVTVDPIPPCTDDLTVQNEGLCKDFGYSPDNDITRAIVTRIREANPGRPIPGDRVMGFTDQVAADDWLLANHDLMTAAVHFDFDDQDPNYIGFTLQSNSTVKFFKGDFQSPNYFSQMPLQVAVQREITNQMLAAEGRDPLTTYDVRVREFAHPAIESGSLVAGISAPFLFAANMFGFVLQLSAIVAEREAGLRQALTTSGMMASTHWASWGTYELIMTVISSLVMTVFGYVLQFDLWLKNSFFLLFFLFLLFQMAMSAFAFALVPFIRKAALGVYLGFAIYLVGWVFQLVVLFGFPFDPDFFFTGTPLSFFTSCLFAATPWSLLSKGLVDLGLASATGDVDGLSWGERYSYCKDISQEERDTNFPELGPRAYVDIDCAFSLGEIFEALTALYFIYMILGLYLDEVVPDEHGVWKAPWFFLKPAYWAPGWAQKREARKGRTWNPKIDTSAAEGDSPDDEDVAAERARMEGLKEEHTHATARAGQLQMEPPPLAAQDAGLPPPVGTGVGHTGMAGGANNAVELYGLQVKFGRSPPFWAVKGSWFAIPQNQLFCLLGPNGAGKSTTINLLTGVLPPTGGDALCLGHSLRAVGGMDAIREHMGVCPQFDVLWDAMTGVEHLRLYARMKGIPRDRVPGATAELLERTKLTYAANQRAGSYSGGMKRRLSVAIALIGNPRLVFLDEPTTGMDPIARRYVWDVIEEAKKGRAMVLTTHSMEEADILGDRIAIMARGRLRCIGSNLRLKQRFGAGYQMSVSVRPVAAGEEQGASPHAAAVRSLVAERLGLHPADEAGTYLLYVIPRAEEDKLGSLLRELEADREGLGITDMQLSMTSLEEVFLSIARAAEMEAAAKAGGKSLDFTASDGVKLRVPVGASHVSGPGGRQYVVTWRQDADGVLVVESAAPYVPPSEPAVPAPGIGRFGTPASPTRVQAITPQQ